MATLEELLAAEAAARAQVEPPERTFMPSEAYDRARGDVLAALDAYVAAVEARMREQVKLERAGKAVERMLDSGPERAVIEAARGMPGCERTPQGTWCLTCIEEVPCCGDDLRAALAALDVPSEAL